MPLIFTLGSLLPFGHKGIVACKVFYGLPKSKKNHWKYACDLFTGQITLVLASVALRDLFWQEIVNKKLGDNLSECLLKTPNQPIHMERDRTLGSTRIKEAIWEFRKQFTDHEGHLVDQREYSREYLETQEVIPNFN